MMKTAADPVDVQDLQFKLQCRLKIFDKSEGSPIQTSSSLIAAASRFGLVFVGCSTPLLKVIRFASIEDYSTSDSVANYSRREIILPSAPQHISVNCDHTNLAVVIEKNNFPVVLFYDVQSFLKLNITILNEVRLSGTPGVKVLEAHWHPTVGTIFTECKTDGTLGVYELKGTSVDFNGLPAEAHATCFCWSPKGRQIAVGSRDGKLTHYKPDLKAVKVINAPPFDKPHLIISLQWISNFHFIGAFKPIESSEDQCCVVFIESPKTGNPSFTNYYDVCYSNGSFRPPQFYLIFEQHWNIVLIASANSMEVAVLASTGETWTQWCLSDSSRAELPLDENKEETYPVGVTIDTSSVKPVPWGESSLQPAPSLLLLSNQGLLCCFKIINLKEGAPSVNSPPENVADLSGLGAFTTGSASVPKPAEIPKAAPQGAQQSLLRQIQQQAINQRTQEQKETKPFSAFNIPPTTQNQTMQTPQFSFQSPQITIQPVNKTPQATVEPATNPPSAASLFGGQLTITPTNNKGQPNSAASQVGSMLLSNLNSGNGFSLPKDAPSSSVLVTPKPVQPFTSIEQAQTTLKGVTTAQPTVVPVTITQTPTKPPTQVVASTPQSNLQPKTQESESQENNEEIDRILAQMVQMECSALENEMKVILFQGKQLNINLAPKDMDTIVNQTRDIEDFINELIETSESQSSEIHILKQNTIQSWAWLEEAKSRLRESQNEELKALMKSKPLDSVSEKHLHTLKQMEYYMDSQLSQAHKALDEQWDKFQAFCQKSVQSQLPTMEAIFQTMVKQNAVIEKHDYILKFVSSQIKGKKKGGSHALFNPLNRNMTLEDSLQNLKLEPEDIYRIYYQKVLNRVKSVPVNKTNQLRRILHNREVPHVAVKSQMTNTSVLQKSAERKPRSIMVHMTPTAKQPEVVRNLNFHQSTPLNIAPEYPLPTQIPSSPLSAFAPTNGAFPIFKSQPSSNLLNFNVGSQNQNIPSSSSSSFSVANLLSSSQPFSSSSFIAPGNQIQTSSANIFPLNPTQATVSNEQTQPISGGQGTSLNFASSFGKQTIAATVTSNALAITKPLVTISQPAQNALFMHPKSSSTPTSMSQKPSSSTVTGHSANSATLFPSSAFSKPVSSSTTASLFSTPTSNTFPGGASFFGETTTGSNIFNTNPTEKNSTASTQSLFAKAATSVPVETTTAPSQTSSSGLPKPLFFTPITSALLSAPVANKPQDTSASGSLAMSTGFTPITSGQSAINTSKATVSQSTTISFGSSSASGKLASTSAPTVDVTSTVSSTAQTVSSTTFTSSGSLFNVSSTEKDTKTPTSTVASSAQMSSNVSGSGPNASSGFSFLAGSNSSLVITAAKPNVFGVSSTAFSPFGGNTQTSTKTSTSSQSELASSIPGSSATTPSGSLFTVTSAVNSSNAPASTGTSNIFGAGTVSSTTTSSSGNSAIFGSASTPSSVASPFSGLPASTSVSGSIFGSSAPVATTTTSSSLFGNTATTKSVFASSAPSGQSIFGSAASSSPFAPSSTFGTIASTATSTSIFGSNAPTSAATTASIFGSTAPSSAVTSTSIFGSNTSSPATTSTSIFGSNAPSPATTGTSIFGSNAPPSATTSTSIFGSNTPSPAATSTIFGSNSASSASPFVHAGGSAFGVVSSSSSPFGTSTTSAATVFGGAPTFGTTTSSSSPFGGSPFGSNSNNPTSTFGSVVSSASPFGTASASGTSPFGGATTSTSSSSPFATTSSSTASPFGQLAFGQTSGFGSAFGSTPATTSSVFGQASSGGSSAFGSSTTPNVFGASATPSAFGSSTAPFGATSSTGNSSPFASSGGLFGSSQSVFGSGSNENAGGSFGFGSLNVAGQAQSPFAATTEGKSPFGGGTFNTTASSGSLFGSSSFGSTTGGSIFGQSSPAFGSSTFGGTQSQQPQQPGPFSGGSGSVAQAGFGATPAFQKPSAFGAQPSFGGSPAFGSAPTFGGAPAFGSTSPFGSPNKVFGSSSPTGVFGASNQQSSPGFGNLANQNTIGFGNLAQQSTNNSGSSAFSGSSSFSSWR